MLAIRQAADGVYGLLEFVRGSVEVEEFRRAAIKRHLPDSIVGAFKTDEGDSGPIEPDINTRACGAGVRELLSRGVFVCELCPRSLVYQAGIVIFCVV